MRARQKERLVRILLKRKEQIERNIREALYETANASQIEMNDEVDIATVNLEAQTEVAIGEQQARELREIERALAKVGQKTFGICEMCGEPIGLERMLVKPHARYCIVCREAYEKNATAVAAKSGFSRAKRLNGV
ncbi:MAG: RNA polymerase-binding protein DksA [Helicobacteraceae bacterium]|jgi:DnaK suppressor protein|nr:RNA polymerase-binding protein DksA [Helicobacteraceae bacterium]